VCCIGDKPESHPKKPQSTEMYEVDPSIIRFRLELTAPYFSEALHALKPVLIEDLNTFAVDKAWRWYHGKEVPWPIEEQTTGLYHELSHLLRQHPTRVDNRCVQCFNIAGDFEINDNLPPSWKQSPDWMYPKDFKLPDGLYAEEYYDELEKAGVVKKCCQAGTGHSHEGEGGDLGKGRCGSGGGNPIEGELDSESGGLSDIEQETIRDSVAKAIQEHQKQRGDVPAGWLRWAEERFASVVPWTKLLRTQARRAWTIQQGYTHRTYSRPPRRENPPILHPRQISYKPIPAFVIDTSGSIDDAMLQQAVGEIYGAIRAFSSDMYVISCDAKVHDIKRVKSPSEVRKLKPKGGGGTDMRIGIEVALSQRPKPNMIVVITDGYTPWPDTKPEGLPFVVVLTSDGETPSYAKTVRIPDEVIERSKKRKS